MQADTVCEMRRRRTRYSTDHANPLGVVGEAANKVLDFDPEGPGSAAPAGPTIVFLQKRLLENDHARSVAPIRVEPPAILGGGAHEIADVASGPA